MKDKTLVLGASANPYRYSRRAIHMLRERNQEVLAIGKRPDSVEDVEIHTDLADISAEEIDTITVYLSPYHQEEYKSWILEIKPRRVIFNPGSENPGFAKELEEAGIEVLYACTLVMLTTSQY